MFNGGIAAFKTAGGQKCGTSRFRFFAFFFFFPQSYRTRKEQVCIGNEAVDTAGSFGRTDRWLISLVC